MSVSAQYIVKWLGLMPLILSSGGIIYGLTTLNPLITTAAVGIVYCDVLTQILKRTSYNIFGNKKFVMRPKEAQNCSYLGVEPYHFNPLGMPSGHALSISFFATFMILSIKYKNALHNSIKNILFILLAVAGMWQRVYVKCHTTFQVICGSIIGITLGVVTNRIYKNHIC